MKKFVTKLFAAATFAVVCSTSAMAQDTKTFSFSTYTTTDLTPYNGQTCNVRFGRYVFAGWNSFCVPFDLTSEQVTELFGAEAKLERLASSTRNGGELTLNFQPCTAEGVKANTAYLLYSPAAKYANVLLKGVLVNKSEQTGTTVSDGAGDNVTFAGTYNLLKEKGLYGIPAKKNVNGEVESVLVSTDTYNGFYPTRCYVKTTANVSTLVINHTAAAAAKKISDIVAADAIIDVYTVGGQKVRSQVKASEATNGLAKGVYVINGTKFLVK